MLPNNFVGKILQTLGVLFLGPLVLDILLPPIFRKPTNTILESIDKWALGKYAYLRKISIPTELIRYMAKFLVGRFENPIKEMLAKTYNEYFFGVITIFPFALFLFVERIDNLRFYFLPVAILLLVVLVYFHFFGVFSNIPFDKKLRESVDNKVESESFHFKELLVYITGIGYAGVIAVIYYFIKGLVSPYYPRIFENLWLKISFFAFACCILYFTSIYFFVFLEKQLHDERSASIRKIFDLQIQDVKKSLSALSSLIATSFFYWLYNHYTLPDWLIFGILMVLMFVVLFFAVVAVRAGFQGGLFEFYGCYFAGFLVSIVSLLLLFLGSLFQVLFILPTRYVLWVISTKTTKWVFALLGGIFELAGIWLS